MNRDVIGKRERHRFTRQGFLKYNGSLAAVSAIVVSREGRVKSASRLSLIGVAVSVSIALLLALVPFGDRADAANEPARKANVFVDSMGVNTHLNDEASDYANTETNVAKVKTKLGELGVNHLRDAAYLNPDNHPIVTNQEAYGRYNAVAALGLKFDLIFQKQWSMFDTVTADEVRRVQELAGTSVEAFEGTNEYDLSNQDGSNPGWASKLTVHQQGVYEAVKGNPSTASFPVVGPSLGEPSNAEQVGDVSRYLDYGNIHSYSGGYAPEGSNVESFYVANARKVSGAKPIMATETGFHNALKSSDTHLPTPEGVAGKYVPRTYLDNFNRGIARTYAYELLDDHPDTEKDDLESNFGLLRNDFSPKPAFTVLKNMIALLEEPASATSTYTPGVLNYSMGGQTLDVHHTLLQKSDGRFYLVLWLGKSSWDPVEKVASTVSPQTVNVRIEKPMRRALLFAPAQGTTYVSDYANPQSFSVSVTDQVRILQLTPNS